MVKDKKAIRPLFTRHFPVTAFLNYYTFSIYAMFRYTIKKKKTLYELKLYYLKLYYIKNWNFYVRFPGCVQAVKRGNVSPLLIKVDNFN